MLAKGNGSPAVCTLNLMRTMRGEVPFERLKGIDSKLVDRPISEISSLLLADLQWLIETYEPRVQMTAEQLLQTAAQSGQFKAEISEVLTGR